jgi:hypothetical protein
MKTTTISTVDGNNDGLVQGIFQVAEGFLAVTFTRSRTFKTKAAAVRWMTKVTSY